MFEVKLKNEPFPHECVRIEGLTEKVFRVRVGDYRILYIVEHTSVTIYVPDIDKRGRVYK